MIVAYFERGEVLLETGIRIDGLAADRGWIVGVAGAPCKSDLKAGLAGIVEADLDRDAEAAASSWDKISETETEARRDFAEVDAPGTTERICIAADVVLAAECDGAAGRNHGGREDAIVVAQDELRADAEMSPQWEPIESGMGRTKVEVYSDIGTFLLESSRVVEEVCADAQVECCRDWRSDIEAGAR